MNGNNMSIKDMAYYERPREKASLYGLENLSNAELLAILISTGTRNKSALDISNELLATFNGLNGIIRASINELTTIKGINYAKALRIHSGLFLYERALLEDRALKLGINKKESIASYFIAKIGKLTKEVCYVVIVNSKDKVIKVIELFKGTNYIISGSYHQILKEVIGIGNRFYLIHNHPSGELIPSENDLVFTTNLEFIAMTMRIELVDHIIVNENNYCSIKDFQNNVLTSN
ncbi:MAG: DNA repair protein RadC [Erysipelotrichaceae bacterium]|nr:DNA repair protein RadC [Erysipelotrichaceae bacterium]